jgi:serine/threonine protein kinase
MDYASFLSDRTVLSLPTTNTSEASSSVDEGRSIEETALRDIWRFLLNSQKTLTYYHPSDFSRLPALTAPGIGEGTSFRVDRAILGETGGTNFKVVAVKYLKSTDASTVIYESEYKSLLLELRILVHDVLGTCPQVVDLLGYGSESKHGGLSLFVVSKYSPFGTLKDFLSQHGALLGLYRKAKLCCDVARGLEKVYASKLAHGDVKLENALVFSDRNGGHIVKISDFGHARLDNN